MTLLEDFYYGNITPNAALPDRDKEMDDKSAKLEKEIKALLPGEGQELFNRYVNHESSINSLDLKDNFLFGFRFGMLMMMEVFIQSTDLLQS